MTARLAALAACLLLGACATNPREINSAPAMTPVGSGLQAYHEPLPMAVFPANAPAGRQSLWDESRANLFQDQRAAKVGDLLTVSIFINDRASLDNTSDRSRDSKTNGGLDFGYAVDGVGAQVGGGLGVNSKSSSQGKGTIDRSERIQLSIAAIVTNVLPNGNLLISGKQEVRVNFELRVLHIAGIVRPADISRNNTISYDKIAEARVSYGGRGRITEVQQPGYGQQIYDMVAPF